MLSEEDVRDSTRPQVGGVLMSVRRFWKRLCLICAITLVLIILAYLGLSAYIAVTVMELSRMPLEDTPASVGLVYEDVSFPSRIDGLLLKGWYIPGGESCVIIVNGGQQNRLNLRS